MRLGQVQLICIQTINKIIKKGANAWLIGIFMVLVVFILSLSYLNHIDYHHTVEHYSHDVREKWDNNPDKHPHRMAHYGYVAFREQFPLSFFDLGMDNYLGNMVFLEAHRQNSINFSQVSMSNGLMRFGTLSAGHLIQLLLPLLIFFWGYDLISGERQSGTLKLLLSQGASWSEIMIGKTLGLFFVALSMFVATLFVVFIMMVFHPDVQSICQVVLSFGTIIWSYIAYLLIMSLIAVWISAESSSQKSALILLIGSWIIFTLIFPKIAQVIGQSQYPTPSKIEFDIMVEQDVIKQGDSHNPDDPLFTALRDSVLEANNVKSTAELPFNYGGFIMSQGEELSTMTFRKHREELIGLYQSQNQILSWTSYINPFIAIKNISMALSGTDFYSYRKFDLQAEDYRFNLAQTMNELQMKHISNTVSSSAEKGAVISQQFWKDFPEFATEFLSFGERSGNVRHAFIALAIWLLILIGAIRYRTNHFRAY